jgi:hypothetical protein
VVAVARSSAPPPAAAPHGLEALIDAGCRRWVTWIDRHPGRVLAAILVLTVLLGAYAATHLRINAEPSRLIAQDLPFQQRQRELDETFHSVIHNILVVIDADSPFAARRAADQLAARCAARVDLFTHVDVPGGGPFFARNALLYLTPAQLDDLADRLSAAQPFLATLAKDQSVVSIADLLRDALAAAREGTRIGVDLAMTLDRISAAVEATTAQRPASDPWGSALLGNALPAEARRRVIVLRPKLDYRDLYGAGPAIEAIRAMARDMGLTPERGIRVRLTGETVLNYEELHAVRTQALVVGVVAFALFTGTICFALRSPRIILALVGSLLVSLVCGNAVAAAAIGELSQISACFNVLIIGLGGEFGIHFCMRYAELIATGRSRLDALVETAATIGSSLFSSAVTTAIGFFIFSFTDFTGVAELGLISGSGMFISLASTLTVLPALLAVGSSEPPRVQRATAPWAARLEHLPLQYARPVRVAAAAAALASVALLTRVRYDSNLLNLRDPTTESVATFNDLLADSATSPWTIDLIAPSLDAAQDLARRLATLPTVARPRTLVDYVPTEQDEKRAILADAAYFVPTFVDGAVPAVTAQRAALERLAAAAEEADRGDPALAASGRRLAAALRRLLAAAAGNEPLLSTLQANVVGSLPEQVRDLAALLQPGTVTLADLPPDVRDQMLAADGRARVVVEPREDITDNAALARFVGSVRTIAPEASGSAVWMVEWGRVTWQAMLAALLGGMACMIVFLVVLWRSVWDTLLAFFPLALACVLTCASLVLLGHPFNFANVVVIPMLIGMGVDNGVHLVHRHRTNPEEVDVLATSTAKAVLFAALTTMLSFGSLGFASHRGMAAFGQLLTAGVAWTLICYVVVLPAVLEWDDRRRRPDRRRPVRK